VGPVLVEEEGGFMKDALFLAGKGLLETLHWSHTLTEERQQSIVTAKNYRL